MNKVLFLCLWWLGFFPSILIGQTNLLFETMGSQKVSQEELQADELDRTYIRFYDGLFKSTQPFASESIAFDLEGERREFTITKRTEYYPGVYSVIAEELRTGSLFIATIQGSRFTAKVHDHLSESTRHIRYDESVQQHYVTTLNVAEMDILGCGLDDHSVEHYHSHSVQKQVASESISKTGASQQTSLQSITQKVDAISTLSSLEDKTTIDILYVYTDAAQEFAETCKFNGYSVCESITTIEAYLAQATILSQSAFDNSGIAIELRPVLNYKVDYVETSDEIGSGERLRRLTTSSTFNPSNWNAGGYMDEVHEIRDEVGADMVAGVFNLSDVGGIAWLLGTPMGYPELAFSLNRIQQILTGYTLAHELGHNMGNAHSRSQTSSAAGVYGGMFHYSVGYQWVTENDAFVSVMGYGENKETLSGEIVRTQEAGVFSSPDVLWQGVAAGTRNPLYGPTNATQSNKEIKLTIADYRPTTVDAPVLSVDQKAVTASMNREEQLEVPVTLFNTGASNLMWRVATEPVGFSKTLTLTDILPQETILPKRVFNFVEKLSSNHVFNETFEGFESRLIGGYRARQGWRTQSLDDVFAIKTDNPSSGQKHLQIQASEEPSYWVRSPFFGPQLEGTFEVSFDLSITKDSNTDGFNAVDLKFYDGVNGTLAAGVAVNSDLEFQTYHRAEQGGSTIYKNTGEYFESNSSGNDSYKTVRIKLNATTSRIEYYLDDVLVDESHYLSADVLDIFYITVYGNTHPLGLVDIDNFEVQRPYIVEWLDIDDVTGAIDPGSQGTLNLSFNTVGVDAGVYQIKLQLINNSQSSTVEIPITLTVSNQIESVGKVTLSTPSDGSSSLSLTPTLSWNEDANAESYTLQVSTDGFNSFVVNESLSGTSYTTSDLEYNTEYSWRVRGSNSSVDGDWSEVWTFSTKFNPTIDPPGTPSLSTPANGDDDVLRPIAFSWEGAARAETYTLEVSEDDFATVALRATMSATSYSTSSLAYKASYSWRVKATNEAGDGDWSEVYTFAMGTPPTPGVVSLSSPANNASGLSNKPTLQWDIEPYGYAYDIQVSKDEFESLEVNQTTEGTSLSPSVDYNQSYSWRVRATNETGIGEWSATRTFATKDAPAPGVTTLSFPSDASTDIAPDTSFVWQPTTYASSYVIEIRTDADELITDTVKTTSYAMSLHNATSYSWRVKSFNSKGSGAWSDTWSFTTVAEPIEAIQNLRPTNGADNVSTSPTFVWQADSNAANYQLQLSEDGFDSMYEQTSTTDTSASVGGLAHRSTYSWRVRGLNDGVVGAWSEPFTFTTQPPSVSVPVILAPAQNADSVAIPTEFLWQADENATSYQAELFTDALNTKVFEQSLTDTSIVYTILVGDKDYLFRVRAVNSAGTSRWSSVEFRTQAGAKGSTTLSSPSDGSTELSLSPTLSWSEDANAESYTLQVSTDGFESFVVDESLSDTSFTTPELEYNTEHSWRVRGTNASGNGGWSEAWSFTTFSQLQKPALLNPRNGQLDVGTVTDFDWSDVENALRYNLEVSTTTDMSTIVFESDTISSSDYIMTQSFAQNQLHYWRVKALSNDPIQSSEWSKIQSFGTGVRTSTEYDVIPTSYSLNQNYPNPFNPTTSITYSLPQSAVVSLKIYDITGKYITTLVDGVTSAGIHTVTFDAGSLSSGMYVYTLETDGYRQSRQMMLVK